MCYQQHVTQMGVAKEAAKICKDAMKFLHTLLQELTTDEAKKCAHSADRALRGNNTTVARKLLKFKEERELQGDSLFGVDTDINMWMEAAFSSIAVKATAKYGDPVIALCEEK